MTNKSVVALVLVALSGFGCAVEAGETAPEREALEAEGSGEHLVVIDSKYLPQNQPSPTTPNIGWDLGASEGSTDFAAVEPVATTAKPKPGSSVDDIEPSAPDANPEPGSSVDDTEPSAPGTTADPDDCFFYAFDAETGEWVRVPCE